MTTLTSGTKEPTVVTAEYNPFAPGMLANPYAMYRAMREQSPIYRSEMMESWVLSRYDDIDAVLMDSRFSADRNRAQTRFAQMMREQQAEYGPMSDAQTMLTSDPPDHTRLRKLVSKAFTPRAVENLRPRIRDIVEYLLAEAGKRGEFDIQHDLAYPLPLIVIAEMLGVPPEDRHRFKHWSDTVVATLAGPFTPPEVLETGRKSIEELADYFSHIIAERRAEPRDDLISGLIAAEEGGHVLSEDEIFSTCILLLIAGNETTTNLLGNGLCALLAHPGEEALLRERPELVPDAIEEMLRYRPSTQSTFRQTTRDVTLHGQTIPADSRVMLSIASANHDEEQYGDDGHVFRVTRAQVDHVAFGSGIHFCLGSALARLEMRSILTPLLRRTRALRAGGEARLQSTITVRGPVYLPIEFVPA
jgi:cytochrome P450